MAHSRLAFAMPTDCTTIQDPPPNPAGGDTLIVDASDATAYPRPSAALKDAALTDQIFIRPGLYEDKIFVAERPILMIGAGRDAVQIFSRRGGQLYLQGVTGGRISGITFRYVGSDQNSAINVLDSICTIAACRATEGILSGAVIYGPNCRPTFTDNEVCHNRESGIFIFAGARPYVTQNTCYANHHFGVAVRDPETRPDLVRNVCRDNMQRLPAVPPCRSAHAGQCGQGQSALGSRRDAGMSDFPRAGPTCRLERVGVEPTWGLCDYRATVGRYRPLMG